MYNYVLSTSTTFSLLFQLVSATVKDGHGTGERANIAIDTHKKGNVKQSSRMTTNTSKSIKQ